MERIEISLIPMPIVGSQRLTLYEVGIHNWNEELTEEQIEIISQKIKEKFIEELKNK